MTDSNIPTYALKPMKSWTAYEPLIQAVEDLGYGISDDIDYEEFISIDPSTNRFGFRDKDGNLRGIRFVNPGTELVIPYLAIWAIFQITKQKQYDNPTDFDTKGE